MENMSFTKTPESRMKIRFHDCDPFNHLNNSRYIDYMVVARTDHLLDEYALDVHRLAHKEGIGWVAAQTQIAYLAPANLDEVVTIQTQLIEYTEKALLFEASMWNKDKTVLKSLMWVRLVHFNLATQKSHPHSEELMKFFGQIVNTPVPGTTWEQRLLQLKNP